ncbi:hypothetical protein [Micrococcus luteus]|uniref:hypothetical protein n=1 Tax=Micrococcus luteus TaxID=1270 RepID=UPI0024B1B832|nr:hypothetical protein [Micrococcus luteus]
MDGGYTQAQAVALLWLWAFLVAWGAVSLNFVDHMIVLPVLAVVALAGAGYLTLHPIVERRRADRNDAAAHPDERGTRDGAGGRRRRRRWENRRGWWGSSGGPWPRRVLPWRSRAPRGCSPPAGRYGSALLGGGAVLALSALTGVTTALVWDRAREAALPVSVGLFVLKIAVFAVLLGSCPAPAGSRTRRRSPPW